MLGKIIWVCENRIANETFKWKTVVVLGQKRPILELVTIKFNLHATARKEIKKQRTHMEKCVKIDTHLFDGLFVLVKRAGE